MHFLSGATKYVFQLLGLYVYLSFTVYAYILNPYPTNVENRVSS